MIYLVVYANYDDWRIVEAHESQEAAERAAGEYNEVPENEWDGPYYDVYVTELR